MIGAVRRKRAIEPFPDADESAQEAETLEIKNLCSRAASFAGAWSSPSASQPCTTYVRIRDSALAAIDELDEGFYRDFSAFCAIEMCLTGNDFLIARELYHALTEEYFRRKIERHHHWISNIH